MPSALKPNLSVEQAIEGEAKPIQMGQPFPAPQPKSRTYVSSGIICAILSLIIVPEIFGALAVILGAYAWKKEEGNSGLYVIIIGIVCMIVGIYFTSLFELGDLIPSLSTGASTMNLAMVILT